MRTLTNVCAPISSSATVAAAMENGSPPRTLHFIRLSLRRLWRSCLGCRTRLARPAVAFVAFVAMLSLAYLAGLSRYSSHTAVKMDRVEFLRRAAALHIAERLIDAREGDTTSGGARLSEIAISHDPQHDPLMKGVQNASVVNFSSPVATVDSPSISLSSSQTESSSSRDALQSDGATIGTLSNCNASALPRWQVDYASHANVDCELLLAGDSSEILKAEKFLNDSRDELNCSVNDGLLAAASCDDLRAAGYGKPVDAQCLHHHRANAEDDENSPSKFRLAFGIRLHRCAVQAELLLRSIYAPQHVYCLHVDGKAGPDVLAAVTLLASCLPNVLLAPPDNDFVYGSVSQLHADLTCMRILLDHDKAVAGSDNGDSSSSNSSATSKWRYFLNVAGQELPLRTNAELVALLQAYNGSNDVASQFNPNIRWRYASKLYCKSANGTTVRCSRSDTVAKDPPPGNVTIYKGVSYGFFSRALVEYVLRPGGFGAQLYDWIADTWAPDEQYFATLVRQPDAPGGYREYGRTTHPTARAVKWSGYRYDSCHGVLVRGVCVLGVGDLPWLTRHSEAFANKFDYERDPLAVQCLVRYTNNASRPLKSNFY